MTREAIEYRVAWKRVGCRAKSKRFRDLAAAEKFMTLFGPEPWTYYADRDKGADDLICCTGYECGCGGETYRGRSDAQRARQPGLEYVRLQLRGVDPWAVRPSAVADAAILSDFEGANA